MDPEPTSLLALISSIDFTIVSGFALLIILLICSALISGAEVALFSLTRTDIDQEEYKSSKAMEIIIGLLERPKKLLATILAKVSNFIPEAGIWMNTQRPEWNDANNALVGNGVSMATLSYLRRFLNFFNKIYFV
ncbi:MAG: DUF21 domain-containing protein, partial [Bizionia sp.]|nr:DUF21 domain-containing protein [Bizionia sp.]